MKCNNGDGALILWDPASLQPIRHIQIGEQSPIWVISFGLDGRTALAGSSTILLYLWDLIRAVQMQGYLPPGFTSSQGSIADVFHPDGKSILTASHDGFIYRFDLWSGDLLQTYGHHINLHTQVEIRPDGALMLTSGMDCTLMLWDMPPATSSGALVRRDIRFSISLWMSPVAGFFRAQQTA